MAYSDSDSKPGVYIVQYRSFHIGSDLDLDPNWDSFQNGYCTHFRDGCPSQGQMSQLYYISIRGSKSKSEPMGNCCIVQ